jgi:adenosylcobinamide-phosphate synthase
MMTMAAIVCGFILDVIFGDPLWLPHPICLIGNLIGFLEKKLRKIAGENSSNLLVAGFLLVAIVLVLSFAIPYYILDFAKSFNPWLAFIIETIMFYQIFAIKSLKEESEKVYDKLVNSTIEKARVQLSWIVGRDTAELSKDEVTKGTIETIAENTADGVIAPMFFMFIGGAPLAFLYKGINTMDSMVGYKNDKFLYFGRCAAKLDDLANFIPARITAVLMIMATFILKYNYKNAIKIFLRDRYKHLSPNSAQTESVVAGALGITLGGGHYYFGKFVPKEIMGDNLNKVSTEDIKKTNKIMYLSATIGLVIFVIIKGIYLL